jgi:hypothetical protein
MPEEKALEQNFLRISSIKYLSIFIPHVFHTQSSAGVATALTRGGEGHITTFSAFILGFNRS